MSKKEPIEITITPGARLVLIIYAIINLVLLGGVYWSASLKQQPSATTTAKPLKQQTKPAQLPKAATMSDDKELDDGLDEFEDPVYKSQYQYNNDDPE